MTLRSAIFLFSCSTLPWSLGAAAVSLAIKVDNFGYRPADSKIAVFSANPGATVQIRNTSDVVVFTIPTNGGTITSQGADAHSGDSVWWVDFGAFTTTGTYRLYSASLAAQSFDFEIRVDIYNTPALTALKTYYYQRCGVAKPAGFAGAWSDASPCHNGDATCSNHAGHTNYGVKNLSGGWHDAGDHNKYAWYAIPDSVYFMLRAFEDNPGVFTDGQLNIPESGNGRPDILDEIKWEMDWLLKMQLPDGSVLDRVRTADGIYTVSAPPSTDTTVRYYKNPTNDSASTLAGSCAVASRVFAAYGDAAYAATLRTAALSTWAWLSPRATTSGEATYKVWAAAQIFQMDNTVTSARTYVDGFVNSGGQNWSNMFLNFDVWETWAAQTYIRSPGATASVVTNMRSRINVAVNDIFTNDDKYQSGMRDFYYYWGSNRPRSKHGLFLLYAAAEGLLGSRTLQQVRDKARGYLHFFHGRNPLSMVYLTQMNSFGGEHSSWMFYHGWFGDSGNTFSRNNFLGKPAAVVEPQYPYFAGTDSLGINDNRSSTLGPAPGYIPGGPNINYGGNAAPPSGVTLRNKAYRDWAWQGAGTPNTWEITENSISSQGPYVALAAYFMLVSAPPTATPTPNPLWSATVTPTLTPTVCIVPINGAETIGENGVWSGANATRSITGTAGAPAGAVTQGSNALRVQVNTGSTWNDQILNLTGFSPNVFNGATTLTLDLHMDATLAGGTYNSFALVADCSSCAGGKWYRTIAAGVDLFVGNNQVQFVLDFSLDTSAIPLLPTDPISAIHLIHNRSAAATGVFHLDNIRLTGACWTPTPTRTPSPTRTPTRTASPTHTSTSSPTPSRTSSPTPSQTSSPTPSPTSSPSPSFSPSPMGTLTITQTFTSGPSMTASPSPSFSASPSPSFTISRTPTQSPVFTATSTYTASPSFTASRSPSFSPTVSSSFTPGPSTTYTPTASPSRTHSPSPTASPSLTQSPLPSPSFTESPVPVTTLTFTAVPPTAAPTPGDGPHRIDRAVPFPNPNPSSLKVKLAGPVDELWLEVYSKALVKISRVKFGPFNAPGWFDLPLDPAWKSQATSGSYYYLILSTRGGVEGLVKAKGTFTLLK